MGRKGGTLFSYALAAIVLVALCTSVPLRAEVTSGTLNISVSSGSDDAEQHADGSVNVNGSNLHLVNNGIYGNQTVGVRFTSVTVPRGSTITSAYLQFWCDQTTSVATDLNIDVQAHDNGSSFSSTAYSISSRAKTGSPVSWNNVPSWDVVHDIYQTPDLSSLVQAIVNRDGWLSGNALVFIITGSGSRVAESYNGASAMSPLLHIEYTTNVVEVSVSGSSDDAEERSGAMQLNSPDLDFERDCIVGLRFQNVAVPQGAEITNAYLEFQADESDTKYPRVDLRITGEAIDDAPAFTSSNNNISNRAATNNIVVWSTLPAWSTGTKYHTPDLTAVVQEIVGRDNWSSGNSMAFLIRSQRDGNRQAESYDGDGAPPLLHIEYALTECPIITVDQTALGASCYEGSDAVEMSFIITNTGTASMYYTLSDDADWLSCSPATGVVYAGSSSTVTVTYSTSTLPAQSETYDATITITDPNASNSPCEISVSLTVLSLPESSSCGHIPVYTENLVSPAILILLDVSGSMDWDIPVMSPQDNPRTPDISAIVQEIVDRQGWEYGNAMAFIITGTGKRTAASYNGDSGSAPLLHVEYNDGSAQVIEVRVCQGSDDAEERESGWSVSLGSNDLDLVNDPYQGNQTVGIRFQNVLIPQGATITNAYIEFVVEDSEDGPTSLTIVGERIGDAPTFANEQHNISGRTPTNASVGWDNIEEWVGVTLEKRIVVGKAAISDLVQDRAIAWGFGTWTYKETHGYVESIDYTKVHVGCKFHDDAQQQALQDAVSTAQPLGYTPFAQTIVAGEEYFIGQKKDNDGAGDYYVPMACQPRFIIWVTDGLGNTGSTVSLVEQNTNDLCDAGITPIAIGFGIDDATQIQKMAEVANQRGHASEDDELYALHEEVDSVGVPFLAYSKQELIDALSTITESIKATIFHGCAPAATTSTDLGDLVIVAKFDATNWSGDLEAIQKNPSTGEWDQILWKASEQMPATRSVFTVDPNTGTVVGYTDATLEHDNYLCKGIGDIINSTPIVVDTPPFYYDFDLYESFKQVTRDAMVYIGANDGSLHAFKLNDGVEKWAFVPLNLQAKLNMADDPTFDMCSTEYCHQYFVDGSPQVADIYDESGWKTILVCGEREGGEAYIALDITYGNSFDHPTHPTQFMWEFTDTELGQTWGDPSIDRVANKDDAGTTWGVFFGSGYSATAQGSKEAYLYGVVANDEGDMWWNAGTGCTANRIKITTALLPNDALASPLLADLDADDLSDRIYVGNLYGTLYRACGIRKGDTPTVDELFDFNPSRSTPNINPIRAKAAYAYGTTPGSVWVYFGTGRYEAMPDKTNKEQQYFFGLKDSLSSPAQYYYVETDDRGLELADGTSLVNLEAKYVTDVNTGKQVRYIEGSNPSPPLSWALKLDNDAGLLGCERIIEQPLVAGGVVFFTTFIPDQDVCAGNGDTWLFALDYTTGLAPTTPVFDLNDDGVIDDLDKAEDDVGTQYNVAAISIGHGQASHLVLFKKTLLLTTTGGGLEGEDVNLPGNKVSLGAWKRKYRK